MIDFLPSLQHLTLMTVVLLYACYSSGKEGDKLVLEGGAHQ